MIDYLDLDVQSAELDVLAGPWLVYQCDVTYQRAWRDSFVQSAELDKLEDSWLVCLFGVTGEKCVSWLIRTSGISGLYM